jgi:hypothetical protein
MRIADGYLEVDGEPWAVFDNDDNFIAMLYSDTPVDLASLDTGKSYYVASAPEGEATPGNADARLVYEAEGGDTEGNWLFQNEYMNTTPKTVYDTNNNPIVPVVGTSYTLFVDGVEIASNTATDLGGSIGVVLSIVTPDNSVTFAYVEGMGGWHFNSTNSKTKSGNVSIRINESEGGDDTGGDTPTGPSVGWLFEDVMFDGDGKNDYRPTTEITRELEDGKSYTLFRGSEEVATETAFFHPDIGVTINFYFLGIEVMQFTNDGWRCTVSGTYSVRIND